MTDQQNIDLSNDNTFSESKDSENIIHVESKMIDSAISDNGLEKTIELKQDFVLEKYKKVKHAKNRKQMKKINKWMNLSINKQFRRFTYCY